MWWEDFDGKIPTPAILKPKLMWTGKQVFSLIIPRQINLIRLSACHSEDEIGFNTPGDTVVRIEKGHLLSGTLCKRTVGTSTGSLVHAIWVEVGPDATSKFLSHTQWLVNYWLLQNGFSIGIGDSIVDMATMEKVTDIISKAKNGVKDLIQLSCDRKLGAEPGQTVLEAFENKVNQVLNKARDDAASSAQRSFSENIMLGQLAPVGTDGLDDAMKATCLPVSTPSYLLSPYGESSPFGEAQFSPYINGLTSSPLGTTYQYHPVPPSYSPVTPPYPPFNTAPNSYNPISPVYNLVYPVYNPLSPVYNAPSPVYSSMSPVGSLMPPQYAPASPVYSPSQPMPNLASPYYSPTTPVYAHSSPVYTPYSLMYSPHDSYKHVCSSESPLRASNSNGSSSAPSANPCSSAAMDHGPQCTCEKSECLQRYCPCFAARYYCTAGCSCQSCRNTKNNADEVDECADRILKKRPGAFKPKGCNCRKSECKTRHCECFSLQARSRVQRQMPVHSVQQQVRSERLLKQIPTVLPEHLAILVQHLPVSSLRSVWMVCPLEMHQQTFRDDVGSVADLRMNQTVVVYGLTLALPFTR